MEKSGIKDDTINRVDWIDCAKGIGMFLVIFGHTVSSAGSNAEQLIRGAIFSFHMPLFFILSCVTFRLSENDSQFMRKTKRAFQHLIIPAILLFLLSVLLNIVNNFDFIDWKTYLSEKINALVYSSGAYVQVSRAIIPSIGMMWFFVVLFAGRSLFDYIHLNVKNPLFAIMVVVMSTLGICIARLQWLPLSFDIALAVMFFFLFGDYLKKIDMNNHALLLCIISFVIWAVSFALIYYVSHDFIELAKRRYPVFPLCYMTAISGTMFIAYLCKLISSSIWMKPLVYIGRFSLYFFCVHAMDYLYIYAWDRTDNNIVNGIVRICVDYILTLLIIKFVAIVKPVGQKE